MLQRPEQNKQRAQVKTYSQRNYTLKNINNLYTQTNTLPGCIQILPLCHTYNCS